jgi:sarcosine oxidase subunit gamma
MILTETAPTALASLALRRGTAPPAPLGLALPGPRVWRAGVGTRPSGPGRISG